MQTIKSKNIIKKLQVKVNTNSVTKAMQIKDTIDSFIKKEIYPEIEVLLKKYSYEIKSNSIQLDAIKIDINGENYSDLKFKIRDKLNKRIQSSISDKKITLKNSFSTEDKTIEAFLFFLENGQLPWWYNATSFFTIENIKSIHKNINYRNKLDVLLNKKHIQQRVVFQLNHEQIETLFITTFNPNFSQKNSISNNKTNNFWSTLFSIAFNENYSVFIENIYEEMATILKLKNNKKTSGFLINKSKLKQVVSLINYINISTKSTLIISSNETNKITLTTKLNGDTNTVLNHNNRLIKAIKSDSIITFYKDKKSTKSSIKNSDTISKNSPLNSTKLIHESVTKTIKNKDKKVQNNDIKKSIDTSKNEELVNNIENTEILIEKAGLILLHPFLPQFFTKLGFYKKVKKQIEHDKIHEATQLLHYLATKNETPYEYELSFEKFLCGVPLNTPINRLQKISVAQKNECNNLLESVISHWKALKTKNIDALRSGFLMREGKLTRTIDSNKIYVQRQAHDILLERIPWGISVINLPWINNITFVEW